MMCIGIAFMAVVASMDREGLTGTVSDLACLRRVKTKVVQAPKGQ